MALNYVMGDTHFVSPSLEEMVLPAQFIQNRYDKYINELGNIKDKAAIVRSMVPTDDPLREEVDDYTKRLGDFSEQFMREGYNANSSADLIDLRHTYVNQINPIEAGAKRLFDLRKQQQEAINKDATLIFNDDPNNMSVQNLIDNPLLTLKSVSGDTIFKTAGTIYKQLAETFMNGRIPEVLEYSDDIKILFSKYGNNPEELLQQLQNNESFINYIKNETLNAVGVTKERGWNDEAIARAGSYVNIASGLSIGKHETKQLSIPGNRGTGNTKLDGSGVPYNTSHEFNIPYVKILGVNPEGKDAVKSPLFQYYDEKAGRVIDLENDIPEEALKDGHYNLYANTFYNYLKNSNPVLRDYFKNMGVEFDSSRDFVNFFTDGKLNSKEHVLKVADAMLSGDEEEKAKKKKAVEAMYEVIDNTFNKARIPQYDRSLGTFQYAINNDRSAFNNSLINAVPFEVNNSKDLFNKLINSVKADQTLKEFVGVDSKGKLIKKDSGVKVSTLRENMKEQNGDATFYIYMEDPNSMIINYGGRYYTIDHLTSIDGELEQEISRFNQGLKDTRGKYYNKTFDALLQWFKDEKWDTKLREKGIDLDNPEDAQLVSVWFMTGEGNIPGEKRKALEEVFESIKGLEKVGVIKQMDDLKKYDFEYYNRMELLRTSYDKILKGFANKYNTTLRDPKEGQMNKGELSSVNGGFGNIY